MANNTQSTDGIDRKAGTFGSEVVTVTTPTTKIVLIYLVLSVIVGLGLGAYLLSNPGLFGTQGFGEVAGLVVLFLTLVAVVRLSVRYLILNRTQYIVTTDSVRREYNLLYREDSREVPLDDLRGMRVTRSRLQAMLGFGDLAFLTVGTSRGIGYVKFGNTSEPHEVRDTILDLLDTEKGSFEVETPGQQAAEPTGEMEESTGSEATAE